MSKVIDFGVAFDVIDEIKQPIGMKSRLVQSHRTKNVMIQTWGSMQGEWVTTQRYKDVQEMWNKSKVLAALIVKQMKEKEKKNA
jgi:hypothetical protein